MKYFLIAGIVLTALLMISCDQKRTETVLEEKPVASAPMIIPDSPDTLLLTGRRNIFLVGRRELPGLFVERSYFPAGYRSNTHTHPGNLNITVISGSFNLAFSSKTDTVVTVAHVYGPGSFVIIPANQPHFEWFTESTFMDITGIGPLKTINQPIIHSTN
ncbi:MAG TPA: cupin domain-containing protein [Chitinophagaceae bacterium]|nr:cupin domain-containing protein [Chitinophagaceae bacterium]